MELSMQQLYHTRDTSRSTAECMQVGAVSAQLCFTSVYATARYMCHGIAFRGPWCMCFTVEKVVQA